MRQGLIVCIICELLALAIWIGGLVVLVAAVIPALFNTVGGQDTGGFFLTRAFEGCAGICSASSVQRLSAPSPAPSAGEGP